MSYELGSFTPKHYAWFIEDTLASFCLLSPLHFLACASREKLTRSTVMSKHLSGASWHFTTILGVLFRTYATCTHGENLLYVLGQQHSSCSKELGELGLNDSKRNPPKRGSEDIRLPWNNLKADYILLCTHNTQTQDEKMRHYSASQIWVDMRQRKGT